jgi:radical SAM protein with 4Fe4S-binding SPASM domain
MVPKIGNSSMSSETFEKMLSISEKILEKGDYNGIKFRLSGGEPFMVWKNYADIVTKYKEKYNDKMGFGILTNLTILTNDMIEWLEKNQVGIQVSLDDLENSKPLNNGESSAPVVLKNIEKLKEAKIPFSMNTVFDYNKTQDLSDLIDYICRQPINEWGLSASFTLNDDKFIDEIITTIKLGIIKLKQNRFDIRNRLRFYNEIINYPGRTCHAGVSIFALGTNLEVWPCQSMINKEPLGYYNEDLKKLLETSERNEYFRNRTLLPQCTDCDVLNWCRGGCRAVHLNDKETVDITCKIKKEIITFILKETQNHKCNHNHSEEENFENGLEKLLNDHIEEILKSDIEPKYVETPSVD